MTSQSIPKEERVGLCSKLDQLNAALLAFANDIRSGQEQAYCCDMPVVTDQENPKLTIHPHTNLSDDRARAHIAFVATQLNYEFGQHPVSTLRAPGFLHITPQQKQAAEAINVLKTNLQEALKPYSRKQILDLRDSAKAFEGLSRLQATRHFKIVENCYDIRFNWNSSAKSHKRFTVADALNDVRVLKGEQSSEDGWNGLTKDETTLLEGLPPTQGLCIARPVAPWPGASFKFENGKRSGPHAASLPVLICNDSKRTINVKPLDQYEKPKQRLSRSDSRIEDEPLIERLHLYQYKQNASVSLQKAKATGISVNGNVLSLRFDGQAVHHDLNNIPKVRSQLLAWVTPHHSEHAASPIPYNILKHRNQDVVLHGKGNVLRVKYEDVCQAILTLDGEQTERVG